MGELLDRALGEVKNVGKDQNKSGQQEDREQNGSRAVEDYTKKLVHKVTW